MVDSEGLKIAFSKAGDDQQLPLILHTKKRPLPKE